MDKQLNFLNNVFANTNVVVVAHYAGLSVADMSALRVQISNAGGSVKVAKNRLVKLALQDTDYEPIAGLFRGQTLIIYSDDPVSASKVANDFAKINEKLVILGGAIGSDYLDADDVVKIAKLPSLDELRGQLVGMLRAPATRIAQVLNAPASQLKHIVNEK